jgi:tRNA(fMet)-specific endonuclease VapC
MSRYMLDTNAVRSFLDAKPLMVERVLQRQPAAICLSVVTEAEMLFGVARHPSATKLRERVDAALATFLVLPWTSATASVYGRLRADLETQGRPLAPLDMMIAAHALEAGAVLVTSDRALLDAPGLTCENWLRP